MHQTKQNVTLFNTLAALQFGCKTRSYIHVNEDFCLRSSGKKEASDVNMTSVWNDANNLHGLILY